MTTSYMRWDCVKCGKRHTREVRPSERGDVLTIQTIEHPDNDLSDFGDRWTLRYRQPFAQVMHLTTPITLSCKAPDVEVPGER
jgi:hypothetical protein